MRNIITILFDQFETLDVFGPVEILGRLQDHFTIRFVSQNGGVILSSQNAPIITESITGLHPLNDVLLIPGGFGVLSLVKDEKFIDNLKSLANDAAYTMTVCTGSILFSKTGLLNGKQATSNKRLFSWAVKESPKVN